MDIKLAKHNQHIEGRKTRRFKIGIYIAFALLFLAAYFLLKFEVFSWPVKHASLITRFALGAFFAMLILMGAKIAEEGLTRRAKSHADKYNLIRLLRLSAIILVAVVLVSFLFVNWYTAAVSLGLISLILGFALQAPISSFIGWINILIRAPYKVGDRIQVDVFKGDVVEINYLDTTLWEFSGDYLTNDVPSGRLIRFPNSLVLEVAVYNYSWRKFPYIWNEIPFHVAYESDLDYVSDVIKKVATALLGPEAKERIQLFKDLVKQSPVGELNVKEYPFITVRTHTNTWVEVGVTYLVEPKDAATTRTRLIKAIISELLKEPEKVMFPKSNAR
jgi:small-conductance mechanosensitive channel